MLIRAPEILHPLSSRNLNPKTPQHLTKDFHFLEWKHGGNHPDAKCL